MPDENPYLEEVTPDTQDVPARIGVPVWRTFIGTFTSEDTALSSVPGLWFASTPEAVAEMRRVIATALDPILDPEECVDATFAALRALGFTD